MDPFRFYRLAKALNHRHFRDLVFNRLMFLGGEKSLTLISTDPLKPQLAIRRIGTEDGAQRILKQVLQGKRTLRSYGKNTEERQLQTWIIRESFESTGRMPFGTDIQFLSADFSVPRSRITAHLLGIDGRNRLVLIELSDKRQKPRLQRRLVALAQWVEANAEYFQSWLGESQAGPWNNELRRVVVWPARRNDKKEKWDHGIEEYIYEKLPQNEFVIR